MTAPRRVKLNSGKVLLLVIGMGLVFALAMVGKVDGHEASTFIIGVSLYVLGNGINALTGRPLSGVLDPTEEHKLRKRISDDGREVAAIVRERTSHEGDRTP